MKSQQEIEKQLQLYADKVEEIKSRKGYDYRIDLAFVLAAIHELKWVLE